MSEIQKIVAREIKDSRGKPTVEVEIETEDGMFVSSCPSGASTGKNEALELRDEDGKGVSKAIDNVNKIIAPALLEKDPTNQKELDELMIKLDGTENKSKLGANAILPVSMALARAGAAAQKLPLYEYINKISNLKSQISNHIRVPQPSFNILNGGAHVPIAMRSRILGGEATGTKSTIEIQEFMVLPQKETFAENLISGSKIFNHLTETLKKDYGEIPAMGDEGGYAPAIQKAEQALYLIKNSIGDEKDVGIALDCAASEFYKK